MLPRQEKGDETEIDPTGSFGGEDVKRTTGCELQTCAVLRVSTTGPFFFYYGV